MMLAVVDEPVSRGAFLTTIASTPVPLPSKRFPVITIASLLKPRPGKSSQLPLKEDVNRYLYQAPFGLFVAETATRMLFWAPVEPSSEITKKRWEIVS